MADALCGPSNALSSLQKHAQVDRSLQQDRLASRQPQQQRENFRSSPGLSDSQIDADFDAFQNGHTPSLQHFGPHIPHHPALQHAATAPVQTGLPAWAADFQQLNIHEARQSPIPAARFRHEAPLQRPSGGSWHAEFMRQEVGKTGTPPPMSAAATFGPGYAPMSPMSPMNAGFGGMGLGMGGGFAGQQFGQQQPQQQQQQHSMSQQMDMFDDEAFAAAFDNAAAMIADTGATQQQSKGKGKEREADTRQEPQSQVEQFSLDHACVEAPEPFFADVEDEAELSKMHFQTDRQAPVETYHGGYIGESGLNTGLQGDAAALQGTDLHGLPTEQVPLREMPMEEAMQSNDEPKEEEERMDPQMEADELSRTAGQLLDNLKHESSDKFAKSSFMALMRQLRDREVKVEGDNFVETAQALHPGGPTYPHDAFQHLPPRLPE